MGIYQQSLPQLAGKLCITDGGLETDLLFNHHLELPEFAAYDLLRDERGCQILLDYYRPYAELAREFQLGLVLETPTWRANPDWANKIGDSPEVLRRLNKASVRLMEEIRDGYASDSTPIVISGCLGPRGDGYAPDNLMSAAQAEQYHREQVSTFAETHVDMIAALTLNYIDEAIGVCRAAQAFDLPACISFTVETDGRLPTGESLGDAIRAVDAATENGPVYYMINCAHPTHFEHLFSAGDPAIERVKGIRGNASCLSHAELDECDTLDDGNPEQFGHALVELKQSSAQLTVLGGCCGTDLRHIEQICRHLQ